MFDFEFFLTFLAAPALQTAKETPRIAFAPNLPEKKKTTQYKTTTAIIKCYMFIIRYCFNRKIIHLDITHTYHINFSGFLVYLLFYNIGILI